MTKDEIIKLAHKAGFLIDTHAQQYQPNCILSTYGLIDENLQRFATLVAEHEQEPSEWRDMVVVTLIREGINKHKARELADHFAAERNNG